MKRLVGFSLAAAVLACSTAFASPGKLLSKGTDDGTPIAFATAYVKNPRSLKVKVTGTPAADLEVLAQVTCVKRFKEKVPGQDFIVPSGTVLTLKKSFKRPENCTMDVQAAYNDASAGVGTVVVKLYARLPKK